MTEVIAVRRLSWEGAPNPEVLVSVGKPAETPGVTDEFYCPIQMTGLGNDMTRQLYLLPANPSRC
jgi:hypothetical protein